MARRTPRRSGKVDEAQALARSCAGGLDFQPCDRELATCAIHNHGKCCRLHWCCHMGWCHCRYVYQSMTPVQQLPHTAIPPENTRVAADPTQQSLKCGADHLVSGYIEGFKLRRVNGRVCFVQRLLLSPGWPASCLLLDGGFAECTVIGTWPKELPQPLRGHLSPPSSPSRDSGLQGSLPDVLIDSDEVQIINMKKECSGVNKSNLTSEIVDAMETTV